MKTIVAMILAMIVAGSALAAPAYPLDELLVRAKIICITDVAAFDGTNVVLTMQEPLRGDSGATSLTFAVDVAWGKPEQGRRYFVFSQGNDQWGEPKNEIKLSQGLDCQGSYCGWIMLPIEQLNGEDIVKSAFSFKFRKPEEGVGPLTLEQAKELVRVADFNREKTSEPAGGAYVAPAAGAPSAHP